jgi:hypothetical protein
VPGDELRVQRRAVFASEGQILKSDGAKLLAEELWSRLPSFSPRFAIGVLAEPVCKEDTPIGKPFDIQSVGHPSRPRRRPLPD